MIFLQTPPPNDLFSPSTFLTLAGSSGIVYAVCGGIQQAFNFSPKWLALLISIIVSFIALAIVPLDPKVNDWIEYLIAFLNGFVIFAAASGINQAAAPPTPPAAVTGVHNTLKPLPRKFAARWWK